MPFLFALEKKDKRYYHYIMMVNHKDKSNKKQGFTLVEVLIAMMILAIALLALAAVVISSTMLLSHSADRETAVSLAIGKLDDLEGLDYDEITNGSEQVGGKFTLSWVVSEDATKEIKDVTVSATWRGVLGERTVDAEREYGKRE